jgi:hypothetical protein
MNKKPYEAPAIIHAQKIEARAVECIKSDIGACEQGPIQS